jgi:aspartate kinase
MIVMKFGGTSTQDASAIANVVKIVKSRISLKPIVVVSAIARATNLLERAGKLASESRTEDAIDVLLQLSTRHRDIINELIKDKQHKENLNKIIGVSFNELIELVKGVSILRELTPRTLDSFYCYGELLSSRLVAAALDEAGVSSHWIDTKDFMITDDNFTRAMPMMELVEDRLSPLVTPLSKNNIVPVTQGFIGVTLSGRRTTMGRESSDYSASIIGCAVNVEDIQIWTDVDGVLTADPTIVTTPMKVKKLSFEEAFELSYFGAKVLHPNTMLPAIEKNIPIHIYNSRRSNLSGTLVTKQIDGEETIIKSVAYKRDVVVLNVVPKKRYGQYIFWEHLHNVLTKYDVVSHMTATSEYSYSVVLDKKNNVSAIKHDLSDIGTVTVHEGKGIVCIVGSNLRQSPNLIDRIFHSISNFGITMISFGASKFNLSFIVDDGNIPNIVRMVHDEFFSVGKNSEIFEILEHLQSPA